MRKKSIIKYSVKFGAKDTWLSEGYLVPILVLSVKAGALKGKVLPPLFTEARYKIWLCGYVSHYRLFSHHTNLGEPGATAFALVRWRVS